MTGEMNELVVIGKPLLFNKVTHPVGATIEANDHDAKLLLQFLLVKRKRGSGAKAERKPSSRKPVPSKGRYKRRDMVADGAAKDNGSGEENRDE